MTHKNLILSLVLYIGFSWNLFGQYEADNYPDFLIKPYLQYTTQNEVSILWETTHLANSMVLYGISRFNTKKAILDHKVENSEFSKMHELTITGLEKETNYFYQVVSVTEGGDTVRTQVLPFKTAVRKHSPFAFTVFSDSQNSNPGIWEKITTQAYRERPDFALHAGDLVNLGYRKKEWAEDFFGPANHFMRQIPMFTILGNHEHDAAYYYQYLKNPEPEHYYRFTYGNAEFFLLDTDQYQEPGTEMYQWLEHALASSTATWKFVVQHHPPYSSEEDDFGNTLYESSLKGDSEARLLVPLFEKYGVDMVFFGHIHSYERTWPILNNEAVEKDGVIYVNLGGSSGRLEEAAPLRNWFTNKLRTTFHFASIAINGQTLQYQAIDEKGQLFDQFTLTSSRPKIPAERLAPVSPAPESRRRIFKDTIAVSLTTVNPLDKIFYTLDGSVPNRKDKLMTDDILLDQSCLLKARAYNAHGVSPVTTLKFEKTPPLSGNKPDPGHKKGLRYKYYTGEMKYDSSAMLQELDFVEEGVIPTLGLDQFIHQGKNWGAEFSGYIEVPESGYYQFFGHAFQLFRFYLHNALKIEEHTREISGRTEVYLEAGLHPFSVEYHTYRYYNYLRFEYKGPGGDRRPITDLNFYYK